MAEGKYVAIPWDPEIPDGDKFYMDFSAVAEDYVIKVSSDKNQTGSARTRILKFRGAMPDGSTPEYQAEAYLRVVQQVDDLVVATFENTTSIYNDQKAGY